MGGQNYKRPNNPFTPLHTFSARKVTGNDHHCPHTRWPAKSSSARPPRGAWYALSVRFRYHPDVVELVKTAVPSYARRYDPADKEWTVGRRLRPIAGAALRRTQGRRTRITQRHYVIRSVAVGQRPAKRIGPAMREPVFKALTRGGLRLAYADFAWEMLEVGLRDAGRIQWVHIASTRCRVHGLTFEWRPADSLQPVDLRRSSPARRPDIPES